MPCVETLGGAPIGARTTVQPSPLRHPLDVDPQRRLGGHAAHQRDVPLRAARPVVGLPLDLVFKRLGESDPHHPLNDPVDDESPPETPPMDHSDKASVRFSRCWSPRGGERSIDTSDAPATLDRG